MPEPTSAPPRANDVAGDAPWPAPDRLVTCEHCDWTFFASVDAGDSPCPHCYVESLAPLDTDLTNLAWRHPPKAYLPHQLHAAQLEEALRDFRRRVPLAPTDLEPRRLAGRCRKIYFPRWLVDADVQATWRGEVGFYYDVVSHEEHYDDKRRGWRTRQITETKTRWEPRLGRLHRRYQNVAAPAMEEDLLIHRLLGRFEIADAQPFAAEALADALAALPNRATTDAWPDAIPGFQQNGVRECREAAGGDKIRGFKWRPQYSDQNWTQLLLPVYSTFYRDDDGVTRPVFIHGASGRVAGTRRASQQRAKRIALFIAAAGLIALVLGLALTTTGYLLAQPFVQSFGALAASAGVILGLGAVIPLAVAWTFNRGQREEIEVF